MRRALLFLSMLALAGAAVGPVSAADSGSAAKFAEGGNYVVQLAEYPVVAYDGSVKGL